MVRGKTWSKGGIGLIPSDRLETGTSGSRSRVGGAGRLGHGRAQRNLLPCLGGGGENSGDRGCCEGGQFRRSGGLQYGSLTRPEKAVEETGRKEVKDKSLGGGENKPILRGPLNFVQNVLSGHWQGKERIRTS